MIPVDSMLKRTALIAVTALAALAAVACGDDSTSGSGDGFWVDTYNSAGLPAFPTVSERYAAHAAGVHPGNCLNAACHVASGTAVLKLAYGGIVYQADGKTRAANVQVGVVSGAYKSFVYSSNDGYYWAAGKPEDVAWATSDIRIRNANGEVPKKSTDERNGDCDSCHLESGGNAQPLKAK